MRWWSCRDGIVESGRRLRRPVGPPQIDYAQDLLVGGLELPDRLTQRHVTRRIDLAERHCPIRDVSVRSDHEQVAVRAARACGERAVVGCDLQLLIARHHELELI